MRRVALVTDSSAGLPPAVAEELGISVAPASFAFPEACAVDSDEARAEGYRRMQRDRIAPRAFGATEAAFRSAIEAALTTAESALVVVTPFDANASFTTASAAMLALQFDHPVARIHVANAGIGAAGLAALLATLGEVARRGAGLEELLEMIEELEPKCDSFVVPATTDWIARAGRLPLLEDRLGPFGDKALVARAGSRATGVALAGTHAAALAQAVDDAACRAGGAPVNVTIMHAGAPREAEAFAATARQSLAAERLEVSQLPMAYGAILGPGTLGLGVCPAVAAGGRDA